MFPALFRLFHQGVRATKMSKRRRVGNRRLLMEQCEFRRLLSTFESVALDRSLVNVGDTVTLSGTLTDVSQSEPTSIRIAWGDNMTETFTCPPGESTFVAEHTYANSAGPETALLVATVQAAIPSNYMSIGWPDFFWTSVSIHYDGPYAQPSGLFSTLNGSLQYGDLEPSIVAIGQLNPADDNYPDVATVVFSQLIHGGDFLLTRWGDGSADTVPHDDPYRIDLIPYQAPRIDDLLVADLLGSSYQEITVLENGPAVVLFENDGHGGFLESVRIPLGARYDDFGAMTSGDFNHDGFEDLAVVHETIDILLNDSNQGFFTPISYNLTVGGRHDIAIGHFDDGDDLDIAVTNYLDHTIRMLYGLGNGAFDTSAAAIDSGGFGPLEIEVADFDENGIDDLAITLYDSQSVSVVEFSSDRTVQSSAVWIGVVPPTGIDWNHGLVHPRFPIHASRVGADEAYDIVVGTIFGINVFENDGYGKFVHEHTLQRSNFFLEDREWHTSFVRSFDSCDLNSDGLTELVFASASPLMGEGGVYSLVGRSRETSVEEGDHLPLSATGSWGSFMPWGYFGPGPLVYEWDLDGDNTFGETGENAANGDELGPAPTYHAVGITQAEPEPLVQLRVADEGGLADTKSLPISIIHSDPDPAFTWTPDFPVEGSEIQFIGSAYSADDDDITGWEWDFGGLGSRVVQAPSFQFPEDGTFPVTLKVTDDDGHSKSVSRMIAISNVVPTVTASPDLTYCVGPTGDIVLATFTDAGIEMHDVRVNWGDNTEAQEWTLDVGDETVHGSHNYLQDGVFPITIQVKDHTDIDFPEGVSLLAAVSIMGDPPVAVIPADGAGNEVLVSRVSRDSTQYLAVAYQSNPEPPLFERPLSQLKGLLIYGSSDSDVIGVDVTGMTNADLPTGIWVLGGEQTGGGDNDDLVVEGTEGVNYLAYGTGGPESGVITMDGLEVHFAQFEPITVEVEVDNVEFTVGTAGDTTIRLFDDQVIPGRYTIDDAGTGSFERVTFVRSGPVIVKGGAGNTTIDMSESQQQVTAISGSGHTTVVTRIGNPVTINEGDTFTLSIADLDGPPTRIDWRDGTTSSIPDSTHVFADDGEFVVEVFAEDDSLVGSTSVTVRAVAPRTELGADWSIIEGSSVNMVGTFADPGADSWTAVVDYGDGSAPAPVSLADDKSFVLSHEYPHDGSYTVTFTLTDADDGFSATDSFAVTVSNAVPLISVDTSARVVEGSEFTRSGSFTDPGDDQWTAAVDYGDGGGLQTLTLNPDKSFDLRHVYRDDGVYSLTVNIADSDGGMRSQTVLVSVDNAAPRYVSAGVSQTVNEGDRVVLQGAFTDAGSEDTHSHLWQVYATNGQLIGDGVGQRFEFTPNDNGQYTATYRVTDDDGGSASDRIEIAVRNVAPKLADAGMDQNTNEGMPVTLSGSFVDPGTADTHSYLWQVTTDNGQPIEDGSGSSITFTPTDNGTYLSRFKVADDDGGWSSDWVTITVANVAPVVDAGGDRLAIEGQELSLAGTLSDAGSSDTHTILWDFGDNNTAEGTLTPVHSYAANGVYTVVLTVIDDDGAVSSDTLQMTVRPPVLLVDAGEDQTAQEGSVVGLVGSIADPAGLQSITWDFGDGTTVIGTLTAAHVYADNGQFTITLTAINDVGVSGSDTLTVTVTNAAPTIDWNSGPLVTDQGRTVDLALALFTDPGAADTHTAVIDWGDGTSSAGEVVETPFGPPGSSSGMSGNVRGSHVYASPGSFTVTISLGDDDGASDSASLNVTAQRSFLVLNLSACESLDLSGNARITIPGTVFVNSGCTNLAMDAGGNARVTAGHIDVVGGVRRTGNAVLSPAPTTGVPPIADPLGGLAPPSAAVTRGSAVYAGNARATLLPGVYTEIKASGNAELTLESGVYVIKGGGLQISGNASLTGAGVLIYNAGSNYPSPGGTFNSISLSGNGAVVLTPLSLLQAGDQPLLAGLIIFQARDNNKAMAISGNASGMAGTIYAPAAMLTLGGNAETNGSLIVNRLNLSGNAGSTQSADGFATSLDATGGAILTGEFPIFVDNSNGLLNTDQMLRIDDAIAAINDFVSPYGTFVYEVDSLDLANITLSLSTTSIAGGFVEGVLGCTVNGDVITLIQGWNWYGGADAQTIGLDQYDFQTTVTHEIGHALGLGHSHIAASVMYAALSTGQTHRVLTTNDLHFADDGDGFSALRASGTGNANDGLWLTADRVDRRCERTLDAGHRWSSDLGWLAAGSRMDRWTWNAGVGIPGIPSATDFATREPASRCAAVDAYFRYADHGGEAQTPPDDELLLGESACLRMDATTGEIVAVAE